MDLQVETKFSLVFEEYKTSSAIPHYNIVENELIFEYYSKKQETLNGGSLDFIVPVNLRFDMYRHKFFLITGTNISFDRIFQYNTFYWYFPFWSYFNYNDGLDYKYEKIPYENGMTFKKNGFFLGIGAQVGISYEIAKFSFDCILTATRLNDIPFTATELGIKYRITNH